MLCGRPHIRWQNGSVRARSRIGAVLVLGRSRTRQLVGPHICSVCSPRSRLLQPIFRFLCLEARSRKDLANYLWAIVIVIVIAFIISAIAGAVTTAAAAGGA